MRFASPNNWPPALAGYAAAGAFTALAAEPLQGFFVQSGARPGLGMAAAVNLVLPALFVAVTLWHPRVRTVWGGALLVCVGFTAARMLVHDWRIWDWRLPLFLEVLHPAVVVGSVVLGVLGTGLALVIRPWRRVGIPEDAGRCRVCGYLLAGLADGRCPECGAALGARGAD